MKVIFTDIDGVLNPFFKTKWSKTAIDLYNKLCRDYDLKIVVTSTWRINHTKEELQKIFYDQGITHEIYDYTPLIDQADRGLEIKEWLNNNDVEDYIVIDDKTSNIVNYVKNVVKIRCWIGLNREDFNEIKIILDN